LQDWERHIDVLVNKEPAPLVPSTPAKPKRVAPSLHKKTKEPGRFPRIGERAKGGKGQTQKGEEGYIE
jgi:hypothetical protein